MIERLKFGSRRTTEIGDIDQRVVLLECDD